MIKKLLAIGILLLSSICVSQTVHSAAWEVPNVFTNTNQFTQGALFGPLTVGTLPAAGNGTLFYVSDGVPGTNPCTTGGTGAFAQRLNGAWACSGFGTVSGVTTTSPISTSGSIGSPVIGLSLCANGQVYQMVGGAWVCASAGGVALGSTGQIPVVNLTGTAYTPQTKPVVDARDKGIVCDGSTDMSATLNALTNNGSGGAPAMNGNALAFPPGCLVNLANTWIIRNLSGFTIQGWSGAGAAGGIGINIPTFKWTGTAGGTMILIDHADGFDVERIAVDGNRLASVGIDVDELAGCSGCVITNDGIFKRVVVTDSAIGGAAQINWVGISLSPTSVSDVGDMRIVDSTFYCHPVSTTSAQIMMGNTFNVKNIVIRHNNLGGACAYGVWKKGGNFLVTENEFGNNQVASIRIDNGTDVDRIENNNEECDPQFLQSASSFTVPIKITGNHFAPNVCKNTSVYHIDVGNASSVEYAANVFDVDVNLSLVIGSSVIGTGGSNWHVGVNTWPNLTWLPPWASPSSTQPAKSALALNPERLAAYLGNMSLNLLNTDSIGDNAASGAITLQARNGSRSATETFGMQAVPNGATNTQANATFVLTASGNYINAWAAIPLEFSGLNIVQALAPPAPSLSTAGTAGSTSYTYALVAHGGTGVVPGSTQTIATGNSTLSSVNSIVLSFFASAGAGSFDIWRTACGGVGICGSNPTGKIGSVLLPLQYPTSINSTQADNIIFKDTGLSGDGNPLPPINSTGSLLVGSNASIAGPRPWIDVTHPAYGADPSCVIGSLGSCADSATALNSAYAACSAGGTVYHPPGTYKHNSQLTIGTQCTLLFAKGATLVKNYNSTGGFPGPSGSILITASNVTIRGLTYNGNSPTNTGPCWTDAANNDNVLFDDVNFFGCDGHTISLTAGASFATPGPTNVVIRNSRLIGGPNGVPINTVGTIGPLTIANNPIIDASLFTQANSLGAINIGAQNGNQTASDISITNNTIYANHTGNGWAVQINTSNSLTLHKYLISNNRFYTNGAMSSGGLISAQGIFNASITGNIFDCNGFTMGYTVAELIEMTGGSFTGNTITCENPGTNSDIVLSNTNGLTVSGNGLQGWGESGTNGVTAGITLNTQASGNAQAITACSESGNIATYTTSGALQAAWQPGFSVLLAGSFTPAGYGTVVPVRIIDTNYNRAAGTFSVALPTSGLGACSGFGTVNSPTMQNAIVGNTLQFPQGTLGALSTLRYGIQIRCTNTGCFSSLNKVANNSISGTGISGGGNGEYGISLQGTGTSDSNLIEGNTLINLLNGIGHFANNTNTRLINNVMLNVTTPLAFTAGTIAASTTPLNFADLAACSAALEGNIASVTDDNTAVAWGATITGGGTNNVLGWCNGTNWTMYSK